MVTTNLETSVDPEATYHLCPKCSRAVPSGSREHFCSNDGQRLLEACPGCGRKIASPFARYCSGCGLEFRTVIGGEDGRDRRSDPTGP
jgi:predicted amidophosphoribosyltransferase